MDEATYKFLMGASAFMIAILGVMLATTMIRPENGLEKLRKARNILVPSYLVLALLSLICCLTGYDRRIEPASTLLVASLRLISIFLIIYLSCTTISEEYYTGTIKNVLTKPYTRIKILSSKIIINITIIVQICIFYIINLTS